MFAAATAVHPRDPGALARAAVGEPVAFDVQVPEGWRQGPGAYGGLGSATLLRAMQACAPGRPARTLSVQFCAPLPEGRHQVIVVRERVGAGSTFASARLVADDRVVLHAVGTFGADRAGDLDLPAPSLPSDVPDAERCARSPTPSPPFPAFLQNYDLRLATGALPHAGDPAARIGAWIRLVDAEQHPEPIDAAFAVALLDAMPPAALTRARPGPDGAMRRMASLALHAQFLARLPDPALDPRRHAYVVVGSPATSAGYSDQHAELYGPDRRLLAVVHQMFAVL